MCNQEHPEYYHDETIRYQPDEPEDEIEPTEQETSDAEDKYFNKD